MADEAKEEVQLQDDEIVDPSEEEESVEDQEESETDEQDEEPSEEQESEEQSEPEFYESEEEYLRELGAPEGIKSVADLTKSYKAALKEMNEAQRQAAAKREEPKETPSQQEAKRLFETNLAEQHIETLVKDGAFNNLPDDQKKQVEQSYRSIARMYDKAYGEQWSKVEKGFSLLYGQLQQLQDQVGNQQFQQFEFADVVPRGEVEQFMKKHNLSNYRQAVYAMAAEDSSIMEKLQAQTSTKGDKKPKQWRPKKRTAASRGASSGAGGRPIYAKYLGHDGQPDKRKMGHLSLDRQEQIVNTFLRDHGVKV